MKALPHLIVLLVLLFSMPILVYYMYTKTYISSIMESGSAAKNPPADNSTKLGNAEIARPKKERAEPNAGKSNPLAKPPRPFGRGYHEPNPNSQSPLSQPPRRVGRAYHYNYSYR